MPLKRTLTLSLLTFYGLGSIIGAGIYALVGAVILEAKTFSTFSFLIASLIALITATTYAELSSRFPESAGASLYINKAFHKVWLTGIVGWLVVLTGLVSSAALTHGLINYLSSYVPLSSLILIPVIIMLLGGITFLGITESAVTIFVMTFLEICGLLIIIWYGKNDLWQGLKEPNQYLPPLNFSTWLSIFNGGFIAFYAFIGFEDMVNLAEETINPEKTMPNAIFLAAITTTILYIFISFVTVTSLPYQNLIASKTPLALIIQKQGHSPLLFSVIAMFSITNGILVNIIMASRLIYGMTRLNSAPAFFSRLYEKTHVPLFATLVVMFAIIIFAYWFPIQTLAKITSSIMLFVFCLMHLSLITIKIKNPRKRNHVSFPILFPIVGFIISVLFLSFSFLISIT